jgi:6-pyruvoyltetrahydropterin/6-carboxytetrahydropterin synthase
MTADDRPVVYLSRRESFSAAHRLCAFGLTTAQNEELFGPCAREYGHGHNYVLDVTLRGGIDPDTGILINLTNLKDAVRGLIIDHVDHRHLNCDSPLCDGVNPTTENLAVLFWNVLSARFGSLLFELRLQETEKNWVIYRGESSFAGVPGRV